MQNPGPRSSAEEAAQPKKCGVEEGEARERREHKGHGDKPVIGAIACGVAQDHAVMLRRNRIATLRAKLYIAHGVFSRLLANSRAAASSLASVSSGPTRM